MKGILKDFHLSTDYARFCVYVRPHLDVLTRIQPDMVDMVMSFCAVVISQEVYDLGAGVVGGG